MRIWIPKSPASRGGVGQGLLGGLILAGAIAAGIFLWSGRNEKVSPPAATTGDELHSEVLDRVQHRTFADATALLDGHLAESQRLLDSGKLSDAIAHFREVTRAAGDAAKALRESPEGGPDARLFEAREARSRAGVVMAMMRRWDAASAGERRPPPAGEAEEAAQEIGLGLKFVPADGELIFLKGVLAFWDGRPAAAADALEQAIRIQPRRSEAYLTLGLACIHLRREADAVRAFEQALVYAGGDRGIERAAHGNLGRYYLEAAKRPDNEAGADARKKAEVHLREALSRCEGSDSEAGSFRTALEALNAPRRDPKP